MKAIKFMLLGSLLLLLGACSDAARDDRRAAGYADRLERGETVSAEEYSEIVSFYCGALDRAFAELEPPAREHARMVDSGADPDEIEKSAAKLLQKVAKVQAGRKNITRLGSALVMKMPAMPDTTRSRLVRYVSDVSTRYSDLH